MPPGAEMKAGDEEFDSYGLYSYVLATSSVIPRVLILLHIDKATIYQFESCLPLYPGISSKSFILPAGIEAQDAMPEKNNALNRNRYHESHIAK